MPEGPSILILKEKLEDFAGKKVVSASGSASIAIKRLEGKKILRFESWGKHFLICFQGFFIRIHLLMFGTYRINMRREGEPRLRLVFSQGEINFYTCHILLLEGAPEDIYDMSADVLSESWDPKKAEKNLRLLETSNVCDALLNQEIFSGVGNIIKNEVLYLCRIHPKSRVEHLPQKDLRAIINRARDYSWDFYTWKKAGELKEHWLVYSKKECPRCHIPLKQENIGKGKRLTFYCNGCQSLY